jgi:hypothetical protein
MGFGKPDTAFQLVSISAGQLSAVCLIPGRALRTVFSPSATLADWLTLAVEDGVLTS